MVRGRLVRRSDGVSTFRFALQNARRKYDGVFQPNDRIIVMMKRISWLRTFTGYLNSVPLVTAWPQVVQFSASCSLKRLQYWFWDPALAASQNMVATALASAQNPDDGGITNAVMAILQNVVGWPAGNIHIAGIPQTWIKWAYKIAKNVQAESAAADQLAQQFYATLGAGGTVGGSTGGGASGGHLPSNALKPGTYAGYPVSKTQAAVAVLIYNVALQMGGETRDAAVGIMTAMTESTLGANPNTNKGIGGSYGIFQQRPAAGWGTVAQCCNDTHASKAFFQRLLAISGRDSMTLWMEAQTVQRSAYADGRNYEVYAEFATQIVNVLDNGAGASAGSNPGLGQVAGNWKAGKATGIGVLGTALDLVYTHPDIAYQEGGDSPPQAKDPNPLDCSSFTQWTRYHATGSLGGMPRTSQAQSAWCEASGRIVDAQTGLNIPGALMFAGPPGAAPHVEISCGTGHNTVGAHHNGTYAGVVEVTPSYWVCAGLMPGIDYSGTPGKKPYYRTVPGKGQTGSGGGGAPGGGSGLQMSPSNTQPWYNPDDPFDKLFGNNPWFPVFSQEDAVIAAALTGPRALLPDQPLLPYLANLIKSTMRSFSSAPNGDFISWFPDYYGLWGTAAIMRVEPIELRDFAVYWDDTNFVTHQFTIAPPAQQLNLGSGTTSGISVPGTGQTLPLDIIYAMTTTGIATIDIPAIMYALFGLEPTQAQAQKFISYIYNRFGARPDLEELPGVIGPQGEFFSALFLFMRSWAYQYNADVPITFMPELWPGMLMQIPDFDFQCYVTTVTHDFALGEGGYFNSTVNIAAPARLPGKGGNSGGQLIGLPLAGGLAGSASLPGSGAS